MSKKIGNEYNKIITLTGISIIMITIMIRSIKVTFFKDAVQIRENVICTFLYIIFFALWLITLKQRIIQKHIRIFIFTITYLELFWILVRIIKYEILAGETALRYAWYLYYLPMLMIPALFLILAVSLGKPENDKPKKHMWLFPLLSIILFSLVLTNDIHKAVFIIPPGLNGLEVGNYTYATGYYVVFIYISLTVLAAYGIILVKCRVKNGRFIHFLPLIPLSIGTFLCILNVAGKVVLFGFYHLDITIVMCLTATCMLEACIQSGLILSNNGYDELFKLSKIHALITDSQYNPIIYSEDYTEISSEDMKNAENAPVMLENGIRLSSAPIKNGHVFWEDDVSELNKVLNELSEIKDYLSGKSAALQQAYAYKKQEHQLLEKNRLYNSILTQTKPEIELYADLIEQLDKETDAAKEKEIAVKIAFVSTFIKRRDNLIFLSEEEKPIAPSEPYYCVEESLSALRLNGTECFCSYELETPIDFTKITRIYEAFYKALLSVISILSSVCVYLIEKNEETVLIMRI